VWLHGTLVSEQKRFRHNLAKVHDFGSVSKAMSVALLIKNGQVVTATDSFHADIRCESETVSEVAPKIAASPDDTVIDAGGKYVFPGFIDPHAHIY